MSYNDEDKKTEKDFKAVRNKDGGYKVTVGGKMYFVKDTYELIHFLDDIGI